MTDLPDDANLTELELAHRMALDKLYEETVEFEQKIGIIIPSIFALVILVGLIGNSSVVLIVAFNKQMRNSTNTLIIGLALSDLLFLTLCVPLTAADYSLPIWVFPRWWCGMMSYLQFVSAYASVWTLVLMALDRFLAVVYPIQSMSWRTMRNSGIALTVLWTIILSSCAPIGFAHGVYEYAFIKERRSTCVFLKLPEARMNRTSVSSWEVRLFYISYNCFGYLVPLGIICVLYYFMLRRLWGARPGQLTNTASVCSSVSSAKSAAKIERVRAKKKVTRMVLSVIVTFALCWLPLNICFCMTGITFPVNVVAKLGKPMIVLQICSQCLAYANSCLNPILYAFLSDNFRKGFMRLFGFICLCGAAPSRPMGQPMEQTRMLNETASSAVSKRSSAVPDGLRFSNRLSPNMRSGNLETKFNIFELSEIERTTTGTPSASFVSQMDNGDKYHSCHED